MTFRRVPTASAAAKPISPLSYSGIPLAREWFKEQNIPAIMNIPAKAIRRSLTVTELVEVPKRTSKVVKQMRARRIELVMNGSPPERKGHRTAPVATPAANGTLIPAMSLASTILLSRTISGKNSD